MILYEAFVESAGGVLPAFADLPTEGCTYGFGGGKFHRQQLVEALITTSPRDNKYNCATHSYLYL